MHQRLFSRRKFLKLGLTSAVVAVVAGIGGYFAFQQPAAPQPAPATPTLTPAPSPTPSPTTEGQIRRVPEDYQTIGEAIVAASSGDTIQVGAGTYPSFVVTKSVAVKGSGAGVSIVSGPTFLTNPGLKHTHNVQIIANGASLTGFTIESSADIGIEVQGSGNQFSGNTIKAGSTGIGLARGSNDNKVSDNIIMSADPARLHPELLPLHGGVIGGVSVVEARGNEISGNTIEAPGGHGVGLLSRANNNHVRGNTIKLSAKGIIIRSENQGNTIWENNLIDNQVQAEDNGSDNVWFKDNNGNYWSHWTSPDDDNDGIVDKPYTIPGKSASVDRYPLVSPVT